ncbi:hypothetical protein [Marinospirillum perlucidum]|uniref:hypothetical protein n=1 Tax=Marinospirillum perlucidum TaxID=1982602 RepID=UPI000DF152F6|nr:hypothetical protein [Marinospirillum perlucidum]
MSKPKALLLNTLSKESTAALNVIRYLPDYTILVPTSLMTAPTHVEKNYKIVTLESLLPDGHQHDYKMPNPGDISLDGYPDHLRKSVEQLFLGRAGIAATLVDALDIALEKYEIKAFITSNETFIHERVLGGWAKSRKVPGIHVNHGFLMSPQVSAYQHTDCEYFFSASAYDTESYLATSTHPDDCTPIETGLIHLDKYRLLLEEPAREVLFSALNLDPKLRLVTFFPTIANTSHLKLKDDIHRRSLERSILFAKATLDKHPDVAFVFKDRPSNEKFIKEEVLRLAKKIGVDFSRFRYVFDYAEPYIINSEITISCASTVTIESLVCGRPHLVFLEATGPVKLYPEYHIPLLDAEEMEEKLDFLLSNPDELQLFTLQQIENSFDLVGHSGDGYSNIRASLEILRIIYEPEARQRLQQDFELHLEWLQANNRISVDNLDDPLSEYWALVSLSSELDSRFKKSESAYQKWLRKTHIKELDGQLMGERLQGWRKQPTFHLVFCVDQTLFTALAQSLESLDHQMYKNFGVSVLSTVDCPDSELFANLNLQWLVSDNPFNELTAVVNDVESDWVILFQPGDILHPTALFHYADYSNQNPDWMLMYCDEDHLDSKDDSSDTDLDELKRIRPIFKPDFNIDLLRSVSYLGRSTALRRDAILALEGLSNVPFQQTDQFAFQLAEQMDRPLIGHLPFVLNHRSDALDSFLQDDEHEKVSALLRLEHLHRCGFPNAAIQPGLYSSTFINRYNDTVLSSQESVDLLMLFPALDEEQIYESVTSLFRIDAGSFFQLHIFIRDPDTVRSWLNSVWPGETFPANLHFHPIPCGSNLSQVINRMVESVTSRFFALVSYDCHFVQPGWLEKMLDPMSRPEIGIVGPRLVTPKGRIFSAGQIFGLQNQPVGDFLKGFYLEQENQDMTRAWCDQNFNALNPTFLLMARDLWHEMEGIDEDFTSLLGLTDLQLRMRQAGYLHLWSSQTTIAVRGASYSYHHQFMEKDEDLLYGRWLNVMQRDSAFNPNLSLSSSGTEPDTEFSGNWHPDVAQRPRFFCAALSVDPLEFNHINEHPLFSWLRDLQKNEYIEYASNSIFVADEKQELHPSVLSLSRIDPDFIIYIGHPRGETLFKQLRNFSSSSQLATVRTTADLKAWLSCFQYLDGVLFASPFDSWSSVAKFFEVEIPNLYVMPEILYPDSTGWLKLSSLKPRQMAVSG